MKKHVEEAHEAFRRAGEALVKATEQAYPVGTVVTVQIGRSTFQARVDGHNYAWWAYPGRMTGTNLRTNKRRDFSYRDIVE